MNDAEGAFGLWASSQGWVVTKRGWPDFLCRRGSELMAVEVKEGSDWLKPEQRAALVDLHGAGLPTYIWTRAEGLVPYPQRHDKTLADVAAIAWELEQTRDRLHDAERELEISRTQLMPATHRLQEVQATMQRRLEGASADLQAMARFILSGPNVPEDVHRIAKRWVHGGWRHWRLTRIPVDKSA